MEDEFLKNTQSHRTIEKFPPLEIIYSTPLLRARPAKAQGCQVLNISKDGDPTASLGNVLQCFFIDYLLFQAVNT